MQPMIVLPIFIFLHLHWLAEKPQSFLGPMRPITQDIWECRWTSHGNRRGSETVKHFANHGRGRPWIDFYPKKVLMEPKIPIKIHLWGHRREVLQWPWAEWGMSQLASQLDNFSANGTGITHFRQKNHQKKSKEHDTSNSQMAWPPFWRMHPSLKQTETPSPSAEHGRTHSSQFTHHRYCTTTDMPLRWMRQPTGMVMMHQHLWILFQ